MLINTYGPLNTWSEPSGGGIDYSQVGAIDIDWYGDSVQTYELTEAPENFVQAGQINISWSGDSVQTYELT